MKSLFLSIVGVITVIALFVAGAATTSAGLLLLGFCSGPFVFVLLGWAIRGLFSGKRLALVSDETDERIDRLASEPQTITGRTAGERAELRRRQAARADQPL